MLSEAECADLRDAFEYLRLEAAGPVPAHPGHSTTGGE
jgi:hypothetical protein